MENIFGCAMWSLMDKISFVSDGVRAMFHSANQNRQSLSAESSLIEETNRALEETRRRNTSQINASGRTGFPSPVGRTGFPSAVAAVHGGVAESIRRSTNQYPGSPPSRSSAPVQGMFEFAESEDTMSDGQVLDQLMNLDEAGKDKLSKKERVLLGKLNELKRQEIELSSTLSQYINSIASHLVDSGLYKEADARELQRYIRGSDSTTAMERATRMIRVLPVVSNECVNLKEQNEHLKKYEGEVNGEVVSGKQYVVYLPMHDISAENFRKVRGLLSEKFPESRFVIIPVAMCMEELQETLGSRAIKKLGEFDRLFHMISFNKESSSEDEAIAM